MRSLHRMAALGMLMGEACREPRTLDPDTCVSVLDHSERLSDPGAGTVYPDHVRHPETDAVMAEIRQLIGMTTIEFGLRDCDTADFPAPTTVGRFGRINEGKAIVVSLRPHASYLTDGIAADSGISVGVLQHHRACSVDNEFNFSDYTPAARYATEVEGLFRKAVHCATH